jgi:hypothetical protein
MGATGLLRLTIWVLLGAVALSPLLWARVPPLVDYPNHLARMWILVYGAEIPDLVSNYVVHWRVLPDLAMDLVVPVLSAAMPVEQAGRVFIALTMVALVGGTASLHRVLHGRVGIWPIWSVLFVYNAALFWGFLNCLFATGLYLFAFSGWIATPQWRAGLRLLAFSVIASLLLLLHLFAFGLYALSVISYEMACSATRRQTLPKSLVAGSVVCLQFVPGAILWSVSLAHVGSTATGYSDFTAKAYALLAPFLFGNPPGLFDRLLAPLAVGFLGFGILGRWLNLAPEMRLPLAAMAIVALLMPNVVSGAWLADIRLPVALPFVIIASTRFEASHRRAVVALSAAALIVLGLRIWSVSQAWYDYDQWFAEFRRASSVITPGARLLVVEALIPEQKRQLPGVPAVLGSLQWHVFSNMAALAVIDRAAFLPYLFTGWTTIDVAPRNREVSQQQAEPMSPEALVKSVDPHQAETLKVGPNLLAERPYWRDWPRTFDFVLWIDFSGAPKPDLKQLRLLASGSFFNIYRVVKP